MIWEVESEIGRKEEAVLTVVVVRGWGLGLVFLWLVEIFEPDEDEMLPLPFDDGLLILLRIVEDEEVWVLFE